MELRQLRYFLEIANQGSFSRAAESLSIAQPALTTQIQKLESEFGARLFHRTARGIALTEVGEVARERARRAVDAADSTLRLTKQAGEQAGNRLRISYSRVFPFAPIARAIRITQKDRPDVVLSLRDMWSAEQLIALEDGVVDVAFVHYTSALDETDLVVVPVADGHIVAALPDTHPLAGRPEVALSDLAKDGFILPAAGDFGETLLDLVVAACAAAGFSPRIVQHSEHLRVILGLVSAGIGVSLVTSPATNFQIEGVSYAAIRPTLPIRYAALYRRGLNPAALRPFIDRLKQVSGELA